MLVVACGLVAAVASSDALYSQLMRLLAVTERTIEANPVTGAALFVLFAALSGMVAFFSSAVLVPVAVHAWGPARSAALLWLGWILGGACAYVIGRVVGRPVVDRIARDKLARYEQKIGRETPLGLVVLFQLALPSEVPGYFLGLVRYRFYRYLLVVAVGELPYAIGTVLLGDSILKRQVLPFIALTAVAMLFSAWAYARLHRRIGATTPVPPDRA
nr:VTT domain-containing protein [Nannocystis sp.]